MGSFKTTKIEYKITTSVEGFCPHCHQDIGSSKTEEIEDDYPSEDYWNESHRLFTRIPRKGDDKAWAEYDKYLKDHPTFINLHNLRNKWRDRIKEMPIKHYIKSETIYVIKGICPTCGNVVELRHEHRITMYEPPMMVPGEQNEVRQIHRCPNCDNHIIVDDGKFKQSESAKNDANKVVIQQSSIDAIKDIKAMKAYDKEKKLKNESEQDVGHRGRPTNNLKTFQCPVCKGRLTVPSSLYGTSTTSDTSEVQCRSCQGIGYIVIKGEK
jgi:hypothetical protein